MKIMKNHENHEKIENVHDFKKSKNFRILFGKFQKCSATYKSIRERLADATSSLKPPNSFGKFLMTNGKIGRATSKSCSHVDQ